MNIIHLPGSHINHPFLLKVIFLRHWGGGGGGDCSSVDLTPHQLLFFLTAEFLANFYSY